MLGTIKGEPVVSINIYGLEQDYAVVTDVKSFEDAYNQIKDLKRQDKEMMGEVDKYVLQLETDSAVYGFYTIRKYKNRYSIKPMR